MKRIDVVIDALTGEETRTERDETPEEKIFREQTEEYNKKIEMELKQRAIARQAILDRLGLTEEEAKLLLS